MKKTQILKAIHTTFNRLARVCESSRYWEQYLNLIRKEERGHRRFKPGGVQCGLSIADSVRLFAVQNIFSCVVPQHPGEKVIIPEAKDFFWTHESRFAAVAMLAEKPEIKTEFTKNEMRAFLASADYAELNKDPHQN